MSYLAQGLTSGFQAGFSAANAKKLAADAKAEREKAQTLAQANRYDDLSRAEERQLTEDARYNQEQETRTKRQLTEDARYEAAQKTALERDARDFAFQKDQVAYAKDKDLYAQARQARQDFSAEVDKARLDPYLLGQEQAKTELLRKQADTYGQPTQTITVEGEDRRTVTQGTPAAVARLTPPAESSPANAGAIKPGTIVEQNGRRYRFDGKTYILLN